MPTTSRRLRHLALLTLVTLTLAGCADLHKAPEAQGPLRKETIHALTQNMELNKINLTSGRAELIGTVADGAALVGMAVEP